MATISGLVRERTDQDANIGSSTDPAIGDLLAETQDAMETDDMIHQFGGLSDTGAAAVTTAPTEGTVYSPPGWIRAMMPIAWSTTDVCQKNVRRGRNCCLFYPLGYCRGMDVVNGFCAFHLKAIFNLVYQTNVTYQRRSTVDRRDETPSAKSSIVSDDRSVVLQQDLMVVAEPQPIDDRITAVFPLFELFEKEPRPEDIKLYNLARYLKQCGTQNWEQAYTMHLNFLFKLITLHSPSSHTRPLTQTRHEQLYNSQVMLHWNLWNEFHSWLLVKNPAQISIFHSSGEDVLAIQLQSCTAITQMVARLFSEANTSMNGKRYYANASTYGILVRNHIAYINNLCSLGTVVCDSGLHCIGNIATLPMMRMDACRKPTLYYTTAANCDESMCLRNKVSMDPSTMSHVVSVGAGGLVEQGPLSA